LTEKKIKINTLHLNLTGGGGTFDLSIRLIMTVIFKQYVRTYVLRRKKKERILFFFGLFPHPTWFLLFYCLKIERAQFSLRFFCFCYVQVITHTHAFIGYDLPLIPISTFTHTIDRSNNKTRLWFCRKFEQIQNKHTQKTKKTRKLSTNKIMRLIRWLNMMKTNRTYAVICSVNVRR